MYEKYDDGEEHSGEEAKEEEEVDGHLEIDSPDSSVGCMRVPPQPVLLLLDGHSNQLRAADSDVM